MAEELLFKNVLEDGTIHEGVRGPGGEVHHRYRSADGDTVASAPPDESLSAEPQDEIAPVVEPAENLNPDADLTPEEWENKLHSLDPEEIRPFLAAAQPPHDATAQIYLQQDGYVDLLEKDARETQKIAEVDKQGGGLLGHLFGRRKSPSQESTQQAEGTAENKETPVSSETGDSQPPDEPVKDQQPEPPAESETANDGSTQ